LKKNFVLIIYKYGTNEMSMGVNGLFYIVNKVQLARKSSCL